MSDHAKIQRVRQGYQTANNEVTKGYRPTQPVDMSNLRIPKNLRDAAVLPRNGGNSPCASVEPKKEYPPRARLRTNRAKGPT